MYEVDGTTIIRNGAGKIIVKVESKLITPELALKMLGKNTDNRALRSHRVDQYVRDITQGDWKINGVPIIFDENGTLRDGQHRLHAIAKAQIAMPMIVATVDYTQANFYDIGLQRRVNDIIRLENDDELSEFNDSSVISVANYFNKRSHRGKLGSKAETIELIKENKDVFLFLKRFSSKKFPRYVFPCGVKAAVCAAFKNGYDEEKLDSFGDVLASGIVSDENDVPIIRLRDYLMANSKCGGNIAQDDAYMRAQNTLKAYELGNKRAICRQASREYYTF